MLVKIFATKGSEKSVFKPPAKYQAPLKPKSCVRFCFLLANMTNNIVSWWEGLLNAAFHSSNITKTVFSPKKITQKASLKQFLNLNLNETHISLKNCKVVFKWFFAVCGPVICAAADAVLIKKICT